MAVPDDTVLQMVLVGAGSAGFVAVECFALLTGRDYMLLPAGSHVDM